MGKFITGKFNKIDHFIIDYPFYGLFRSARVTPTSNDQEVRYECVLLNGSIITLKKSAEFKKWIDVEVNGETPLSSILGGAIDDFLKSANHHQ